MLQCLMTQGAQRADMPSPDSGTNQRVETEAADWSVLPMGDGFERPEEWQADRDMTRSTGTMVLGGVLIALALAWAAGITWLALQSGTSAGVQGLTSWVALACPPLILLGLV